MLNDLRCMTRNLRRSPVGAAAATLTLALTLGAGVSIFAVSDAVLLTPPPLADPQDLVTVGETLPSESQSAVRAVTFRTFEAWRDRAGSMAILEAYDATNLTLTGHRCGPHARKLQPSSFRRSGWDTTHRPKPGRPIARCHRVRSVEWAALLWKNSTSTISTCTGPQVGRAVARTRSLIARLKTSSPQSRRLGIAAEVAIRRFHFPL
jgi:hypothetical protein